MLIDQQHLKFLLSGRIKWYIIYIKLNYFVIFNILAYANESLTGAYPTQNIMHGVIHVSTIVNLKSRTLLLRLLSVLFTYHDQPTLEMLEGSSKP